MLYQLPPEPPTQIQIITQKLDQNIINEISKKLLDAQKKKQTVTPEIISNWLQLQPKSCDGNTGLKFCIWKEGSKTLTVYWKRKFKTNTFILDTWSYSNF